MLIYPTTDPRRYDKRLYKGGDGGAADMRKDEEARQAKVQAAVNAINAKFGINSGPVGAAPDRAAFTTGGGQRAVDGSWDIGGGDWGGVTNYVTDPTVFDEAGFNKAMADWQAQQTDVSGAKAARDALYGDIEGAVRDVNVRTLDKQFGEASKQNLFGLARSGLLGGSVDAESGADLQERYGEGKIKAVQAGQSAASELRANDEKTRQNLIGLAQSGIDTGTAASLAAGQMGAAAELARSNTSSASIGDLFSNLSQGYLANQQLKARYPNGLPGQSTGGGYFSNLFGGGGYAGTVSA